MSADMQLNQKRFGDYVRQRRLEAQQKTGNLSVRQLAQRMGVQPSYLSKVERGEVSLPTEARIRQLATELGQDPDVLLAVAGKISQELREIIVTRPTIFAELLRELKSVPDHAVLRVVREVRDGDW